MNVKRAQEAIAIAERLNDVIAERIGLKLAKAKQVAAEAERNVDWNQHAFEVGYDTASEASAIDVGELDLTKLVYAIFPEDED